MKWNRQFIYPKSVRSLIDEERHYSVGDEKLPSVTTILAATQPDEKRESLQKWKDKVGQVEADKIKNLAASRGTAMHSYLEAHLNGQGLLDLSDLGQAAGGMARTIIEKGFGEGQYKWADGSQYEGVWLENKIHGYGSAIVTGKQIGRAHV